MKFQIAFLSLLTTAAYAQHEPKGLRGSVEDFDFLENNDVTVGQGFTATITGCGFGGQCCVQYGSSCGDISGGVNFGGDSTGCSSGVPLTSGMSISGGSNCNLSCSGTCNVSVTAGGGGSDNGGGYPSDGEGGQSGGSSNNCGYGCCSMPTFVCERNPHCSLTSDGSLCVVANRDGYNCGYGCCSMPAFVCRSNPNCSLTSDGSKCVLGESPYEELDEEVDYDPSFDGEDEEMSSTASEDHDPHTFDMDMAEE